MKFLEIPQIYFFSFQGQNFIYSKIIFFFFFFLQKNDSFIVFTITWARKLGSPVFENINSWVHSLFFLVPPERILQYQSYISKEINYLHIQFLKVYSLFDQTLSSFVLFQYHICETSSFSTFWKMEIKIFPFELCPN